MEKEKSETLVFFEPSDEQTKKIKKFCVDVVELSRDMGFNKDEFASSLIFMLNVIGVKAGHAVYEKP